MIPGRKLYLEAIRKLPEHLISDETRLMTIGENRVVVCHFEHAPMIYDRGVEVWEPITLNAQAQEDCR